jgi:DNA-3-methyladenine glycosylase
VDIRLKRVYDEPAADDGVRVLVDRLWPRGVRTEDARLDAWLKDVAPSTRLRTEFGHRHERFDDFRAAYLAELDDNPALAELRDLAENHPRVTLLYAARDTQRNHAVVLAEALGEPPGAQP